VETIQEISLGIGIAIAVFGSMGWFMTFYQQPDLTYGDYFESAWLDIKPEQLTLYIEFVPDGQGRAILAVREAYARVKAKARVNPAIDGRPVVVVLMVREDTVLVPISSIVIYSDTLEPMKFNKSELAQRVYRNMTFLRDGNNTISVINKTTGERIRVNLSVFQDKDWLNSYACVPMTQAEEILKYK
jgi:hypothetical protein